jgi:hypothetical protein
MILVDRIEDGIAVYEVNGTMTDILLINIKRHVSEGDMPNYSAVDSLYTVDP